ncbi:MAG: sugar kinase [Alphaproteobacteria bacterium]|nr:sugar kinase [Alphaproteobacteria bacterium]
MTTAISIGECMVELRPVADGHLRRGFAGDAYNTAVYLKRSAPDIDVAFLTATGDDVLSDSMIETWRAEGISDRLTFRIPGARPALYLIETNEKGDRKFHYWRSETPAKQWLRQLLAAGGADLLDPADLVYVSGISLAILNHADRQAAIELLGSLKTRVAFDPNIRPALWKSMDEARHAFEAMTRLAAIVLPSRQDYELMYDISDPNAQIEFTAGLTEGEIALTCDEEGCLLRVDDSIQAMPTQAVAVVDTSGAGDSFNGAYLAARLGGASPQDAARAGLAMAAKVVAQPGAVIAR